MADPLALSEAIRTHPANVDVLRYLAPRARHPRPGVRAELSCAPESVRDPYTELGTHPDLVSRLWDEITVSLPTRCKWVVYGVPVLMRPDSGVIFAFAQGTHTYALRLAGAHRAEALGAALERANRSAEELGLIGEGRESYVAAHSGRAWKYPDGSTLDLGDIGDEWVFGRWLEGEVRWCGSAYDHAA